jgi:hypothetical protein
MQNLGREVWKIFLRRHLEKPKELAMQKIKGRLFQTDATAHAKALSDNKLGQLRNVWLKAGEQGRAAGDKVGR